MQSVPDNDNIKYRDPQLNPPGNLPPASEMPQFAACTIQAILATVTETIFKREGGRAHRGSNDVKFCVFKSI